MEKKNEVRTERQVIQKEEPDTLILEKVIGWCQPHTSISKSPDSIVLMKQVQKDGIERINLGIDELYSDYEILTSNIQDAFVNIDDLKTAREKSMAELRSILKATHLSQQSLIKELENQSPNLPLDDHIKVQVNALFDTSEADNNPTEHTYVLEQIEEDPVQSIRQNSIEAASSVHSNRPFGQIDRPLERFLLFGGKTSLEILARCVHRYLRELSPDTLEETEVALPSWCEEPFQAWYNKRQEHAASKLLRGGKQSRRGPFLRYDRSRRVIFLVIPVQQFPEGLKCLHGTLCIWDEREHLMREIQVPLYQNTGSIFTEEVSLEVEEPSKSYYLELITDGTPLTWTVPGLSEAPRFIAFDDDIGRVIDSDCEISDRFILILEKGTICVPEAILLESGYLYGGWHQFYTCTIRPDPGNPIRISSLVEEGDIGCKPLNMVGFDTSSWPFDPLVRLNDLRTILGSPPELQIPYKDRLILGATEIGLYPSKNASISEPIFCTIAEIADICDFDKIPGCCSIPLSDDRLLGSSPYGIFTCKVQNRLCRSNSRYSFALLPEISYRMSRQIYVPTTKESSDPYVAEITHPSPYILDPINGTELEKTNAGCILHSATNPCLQTSILYNAGKGKFFHARLALTLPHMAWRFKTSVKTMQNQLFLNPRIMTEDQLDQYGGDLDVVIFLPEEYRGYINLIESTQEQAQTSQLVAGMASFPFEPFRDAIIKAREEKIDFDLVFSGDGVHDPLNTHLFTIQKWKVDLTEKPVITVTKTGENILNLAWEENISVSQRSVCLWQYDSSERPPKKVGEDTRIRDGVNEGTIRQIPPSPPGIYYLQFYWRADQWAPETTSFAGEQDINTFRFTIELKKEDLLRNGDMAFVDRQYSLAVAYYIQLQTHNPNLGYYWRYKILNELIWTKRTQEVIFCFDQLLDETILTDIDVNFVTFQLQDIFKQVVNMCVSDRIDAIFALFKLFDKIIHSDHTTSKKIIESKISDLERTLNQCKDLDEEMRGTYLNQLREFVIELTKKPTSPPQIRSPDPPRRRYVRKR